MAFLNFAGDQRKLDQIYASIDAGEQIKAKQRDTGPGEPAYAGGAPLQRAEGLNFDLIGARGEFYQATRDKENFDHFADWLERDRFFRDREEGLA